LKGPSGQQGNVLARVLTVILDNSLLLLAGTATAVLWANLDPHGYEEVAHSLHFGVNEVGMVFFFAVATKEVFEATLPGGSLSSLERAAVPLIAACGGMIAPALLYIALVSSSGHSALAAGWAIPCATDIAFSYLVARFVFGPSHPALPFLLLLAIADDALGLVILAVFYPSAPLQPLWFAALFLLALGTAWGLRKRRTPTFWPYVLLAGPISWAAFYVGGLHPSLALVPVVPFIPHARTDIGLFDAREADRADPLNRFEHMLKVPVQVILMLFGFVNAGVPFADIGPGTWIVLASIAIGKPLGIGLFTELAALSGLARPTGITRRDVIVVGFVAGIGFTVALFFATAAFPPGPLLDQTKMGALFSFGAALVTLIGARSLRVGRFRLH
jgi:Na+:H+ antiporter, NhaA family